MNGFKASNFEYIFRILKDWTIDVEHKVTNLRCELV